MNVVATEPATIMNSLTTVVVVSSSCSFCDIVRSVGEMCHRPNSTDDSERRPA